MEKIYQLYDKVIKRILTLSAKTVINLINGLFGTDYPTDSKIAYNWTEHEDKDLKKTLSDSILTINGKDSYHIEAQMTEDEEIVFRVIEYGFGHAYKNRVVQSGSERMIFPEPCVIYLDEGKKDSIPEEYTVILEFKDQGEFHYKVPVVKLQNISVQELNDRKLIALLPFLLLKLRKKLEKVRTRENLEELQNLVMNDIINSIDMNEAAGNISPTDAFNLKALTTTLYMQIYSDYQELEELTVRLYDQSLELPSDKYEKTVEELQEEVAELHGEVDVLHGEVSKMQDTIQEQADMITEKDNSIKEKDALINELQQKLKNLQN